MPEVPKMTELFGNSEYIKRGDLMGKQSRIRRDMIEKRVLQKKQRLYDMIYPALPAHDSMPVIVLDSISDYLKSSFSPAKVAPLNERLITIPVGVRPPFEKVFLEIKNLAGKVNGGNHYFGMFVQAVDIEQMGIQSPDEIADEETIMLVIRYYDLHEKPKARLLMSNLQNQVYLKATGMYSSFSVMDNRTGLEANDDTPDHALFLNNFAVHLALFTFSLLNCQNIKLVDNPASNQSNVDYEKHFGRQLVKYKTLSIKGFGEKSYSNSQAKEYQGLMPLHIRRGNYATYTDDAPLFGKFTGTFWRPATAVGEEKNGVVVKDYKVLPPEGKAS